MSPQPLWQRLKKGPDPNTFWGKFWLSFLDKVVIGFIAAAITFGFQYYQHLYQKIADEGIAVSKIYTDILVKQRDTIIQTMGEYFATLDDISKSKRVEKGKTMQLSKILHKLNFTVDTLGLLDQELENSAKPLLSAMSKFNRDLIMAEGKEPPLARIEKETESVQASYREFLEKYRKITVVIVKREVKAAR